MSRLSFAVGENNEVLVAFIWESQIFKECWAYQFKGQFS